jgi:hypothetical protein
MTFNTESRQRKAETGYEPDGHWQDVWVEVKFQTHGFRNLRASLLGLAYWLTSDPASRGLLVLADSRITEERLNKERRLAEQVLPPEVMRRLHLVIAQDKHYVGLPPDLGADFRSWLDRLVLDESGYARPRQRFYDIFQVLLHHWLLGKGPVTADWLGRTAGCSAPTVTAALRRLDHCLLRHTNRRVELRYFPKDEWARLVAVADDVRSTRWFVDRSGQLRSPESHLRRLQKLDLPNLAVGGVIGAKHHYPDLDLVGAPRVDLSLHCPGVSMDIGFIEKLDPALEEVKDSHQPASVVVHAVRRTNTFFEPGDGLLSWADPVECLLDLHEARLEAQAADFLRYFENRRSRTP